MCIYCNTNNYRKIYEQHNGPIPIDTTGRSFEIHHIDGDRNNNNPINLRAVSIEEHLNIHLDQEDWAAASAIMQRLAQDPGERSMFLKHVNMKRLEAGTHHFIGERNPSHKRVAEGTHHFIGGEIAKKTTAKRIQAGSHNFQGSAHNLKRVAENRHPFVGGAVQRQRFLEGTHQNQTERCCPHCGKIGKGPTMLRFHFDRCKSKPI